MAPTKNIHQIWSRVTSKTLLLLAILALLAAACSGSVDTVTDAAGDAFDGGDDSSVETSEVFDAEEEAMEDEESVEEEAAFEVEASEAPASERTAAQTATGSTAAAQIPTDLGRDIIFTAQVSIRVEDVATTGRQATEVISDLGGFVFGEESVGGAQPETTLTFKVRPEDFSTALEQLSGIGELTSQRITTDDLDFAMISTRRQRFLKLKLCTRASIFKHVDKVRQRPSFVWEQRRPIADHGQGFVRLLNRQLHVPLRRVSQSINIRFDGKFTFRSQLTL